MRRHLAALSAVTALGLILGACSSGGPRGTGAPPSTPGGSAVGSGPSVNPGGPIRVAGSWVTYGGSVSRSGVATSFVRLGSFRRAWASPALDGAIYEQPLVFAGRVYVATENDTVYALDQASGRVVWRTHLGEPMRGSQLPCGNIDPSGITGTPAIDPSSGLLYAVAFVQPGRHELAAIETSTGRVRFTAGADLPGLDALVEQQRAALVITAGRVYVAYGGLFGDCGPYHGAVLGIPLDGRGPAVSYRVPSRRAAGIWAPPGPVVDTAGNLLVATGNSESTSSLDQGNTVLRLSPDLRLLDSFTPASWVELNRSDTDLGSTSPTLLPGGEVFQVGKEGVGYLLRGNGLGGTGRPAFSGPVCGGAFGATAVLPPLVLVPCTDGLVAVRVSPGPAPSFAVAWRRAGFQAGPPIVAGGLAWTVDLDAAALLGLDPGTGAPRARASLGAVNHFAAPSAAGGVLLVPAGDRVVAFAGT